MSSYLIKKEKETKEIIAIEYSLKGYQFKPKQAKTHLNINQVTIISPSFIDKVLTMKFNILFRRIASLCISVLNDDDNSEDQAIFALGEIAKARAILERTYKEFLSREKTKQFLKKIAILEEEVKAQILIIEERKIAMQMEEEPVHHRSR